MRPERFRRLRAILERRQPDLTVLMDGVDKSHNFSAVLRSCDAAGVLEAHVVPPLRGLDVHHTSSAGTKKWIRVRRHAGSAEAVSHLKERGFRVLAAHFSDEALDYREADYTRPTAIVLGAEKYGVSDDSLALADEVVFIPLAGMVRSLNVSVAAALILFEAKRQREAAGLYERSRLDPDDLERTLFEWAHPTVARLRRAAGEPYQRLTPDGEIAPD